MSVSKAYARALYQATTEGKPEAEAARLSLEADTQLANVLECVQTSKELKGVFFAPIVTSKEKGLVITELSKKLGLSGLLKNFLILLANKGRLPLLSKIQEEFVSVRLLAEGGIPGKLVSAEQIEPADVEVLSKAFTKKLGKKVAFQISTDAALLAGVKVTINGVTYDGTLRSQLQKLRDRLVVGIANGQ